MNAKSILIVGGGTAGWLTAAYLNKVLQYQRSEPVSITVVASEEVPVIGVGEATVPTLRSVLAALDIPEWQFLTEAEATFKLGIKFRNWRYAPSENAADAYYHLFQAPTPFEGAGPAAHWLNAVAHDQPVAPYAEAIGPQAALCEHNRSPKLFSSRDYDAPVNYAYHVNAEKFGQLLKRLAISRGARYIPDTVTAVALDPQGCIAAIRTKEHGDLHADLYVDCTGFQGLLIEQALGEPFIPYGDVLLCDRAVALPVPYSGERPVPRTYTTSTALSSGWCWEIDLSSRRGTGYVYSSQALTPSAAEDELRRFLGPSSNDVPARHLQMRVGRRRNAWVQNCLSIGLSAGFIEPLESTGIYLIEIGLQLFLDYLTVGVPNPRAQQRYNQAMAELYESIRDFIVLHYCLTERTDSEFWSYVGMDHYLPARVKEWIELWSTKPPTLTDLSQSQILFFGPQNYFAILSGMGYLPDIDKSAPTMAELSTAMRFFEEMRKVQQVAVDSSPPHDLYLAKLQGAAIKRA